MIQQRRERENRQINERLRTLIAAYKTLGGSFTGNLAVDPTHLRELRQRSERSTGTEDAVQAENTASGNEWPSVERSRRIRDAVEAALSDIILLGTEQQVRLAAKAASELAAGRPTHTAELVVSLRDFIRQVLDLEPVPAQLSIPRQGPARVTAARGKGNGGAKDEAKGGGMKGMGDGGSGAGMGMGGSFAGDDDADHPH